MSEARKTKEELIALMDTCPPFGSRWRHKTSGVLVTVTYYCLLEETCEPVVCYLHDGIRWCRSLGVFRDRFEPIEKGGA